MVWNLVVVGAFATRVHSETPKFLPKTTSYNNLLVKYLVGIKNMSNAMSFERATIVCCSFAQWLSQYQNHAIWIWWRWLHLFYNYYHLLKQKTSQQLPAPRGSCSSYLWNKAMLLHVDNRKITDKRQYTNLTILEIIAITLCFIQMHCWVVCRIS